MHPGSIADYKTFKMTDIYNLVLKRWSYHNLTQNLAPENQAIKSFRGENQGQFSLIKI